MTNSQWNVLFTKEVYFFFCMSILTRSLQVKFTAGLRHSENYVITFVMLTRHFAVFLPDSITYERLFGSGCFLWIIGTQYWYWRLYKGKSSATLSPIQAFQPVQDRRMEWMAMWLSLKFECDCDLEIQIESSSAVAARNIMRWISFVRSCKLAGLQKGFKACLNCNLSIIRQTHDLPRQEQCHECVTVSVLLILCLCACGLAHSGGMSIYASSLCSLSLVA